MKNLVRNTVSIFAMFILTVATALANDPDFKLEKVADKTISLKIENFSSPINISFKDAKGELIYKEIYYSDKISMKKYNLKEIASGKYYFEIETEISVKKYLVVVNNKTAEIIEEPLMTLHKPMVALRGNGEVMLTKLNFSKDNLKVLIYDEAGNSLYENTILADTGAFTIGQKYDFSKIKKGSYVFYMTTDKRTYKKTVNL